MGRIFNMDGPLFTFLNRMADMAILNVLFIITSLPIFTIGASLTALSYVTQKMRDGEEGYVWKSYFRSFRQNFKQGTLMWLLMLALALILYVDYRFAASGVPAFLVVVLIGLVLWFFVVSYAFPLLARFENTVPGTLRNALFMSLGNAPRMLLMTAVTAGAVVLTAWNANTLVWGILVWLLFGFAILSYINSALQYNMFKRFLPEEEESADPDQWEVTASEDPTE